MLNVPVTITIILNYIGNKLMIPLHGQFRKL